MVSHLLVVDDDIDFVKVAAKVLQKAGHEVTSARNGEQAPAMMRRNVPDLVLLDMMMSYIVDGLDARRAMTEDPFLKAVPVIMMTSATVARGDGTAATGEDIPVTLWLSKPIKPDKLLASVNQALA